MCYLYECKFRASFITAFVKDRKNPMCIIGDLHGALEPPFMSQAKSMLNSECASINYLITQLTQLALEIWI